MISAAEKCVCKPGAHRQQISSRLAVRQEHPGSPSEAHQEHMDSTTGAETGAAQRQITGHRKAIDKLRLRHALRKQIRQSAHTSAGSAGSSVNPCIGSGYPMRAARFRSLNERMSKILKSLRTAPNNAPAKINTRPICHMTAKMPLTVS